MSDCGLVGSVIAPDMVEMGVHIKEAFATHFVEHHRPCGHARIVGVPSFGAGDIHLLRFCNPEVAQLSKEIANYLSISINTVNRHRQNIFEKHNVDHAIGGM